MDKHFLIIAIPLDSIRVVAELTKEHESRFKEILESEEQTMATFVARSMSVIIRTRSGSKIVIASDTKET